MSPKDMDLLIAALWTYRIQHDKAMDRISPKYCVCSACIKARALLERH